jgi:RNA polymerase sigma-70 factor (ECF subfamily)
MGMEIIRQTGFARTAGGEAEFVHRLKQFEAAAWNDLYDAHAAKLHRYLFLRVGDGPVAEELTAQVFEEACQRIGSYRFRGPPISAWLYKVAHNRMVDWRRKHKALPLAVDVAGPDSTAAVADRDEIARAMDGLTGDQQRLLILRHIEGHSPAEAAEIMGKKAGAIRALEFRALNALKRRISGAQGGAAAT